jgi:ABC-2 type transport system ATP-binding protein
VPAPTDGADGAVTLRVPTDGSPGHVRHVLAAVESTAVVPQHWSLRAPTLDDVFLTVTGHRAHPSDAEGPDTDESMPAREEVAA